MKYLLILCLCISAYCFKIQASQEVGVILENYYPNSEQPNEETFKCFLNQNIKIMTINMWVYPWRQVQLLEIKKSLLKCKELKVQNIWIRLPIYYRRSDQNPPKVVMESFKKNINSSSYNYLWLEFDMDPKEDADCATILSYITQCKNMNIQCGFIISKSQWDIFSNGNKFYCPSIASQQLMFEKSQDQSFQPFGGWSKYDFTLNTQQTTNCPWSGHNFMISK